MSLEISCLSNGLHVVTHHMPHLETVALGVWVKAGARDEEPRENGIAHFLEHRGNIVLLFKALRVLRRVFGTQRLRAELCGHTVFRVDREELRILRATLHFVFIHQDLTVTRSMWENEDVIFNQISPEWRDFCARELGFKVPDDLDLIASAKGAGGDKA